MFNTGTGMSGYLQSSKKSTTQFGQHGPEETITQ